MKAQVVTWQDFKGTVYCEKGIFVPEKNILIAFDPNSELIVKENASDKICEVCCHFDLSEERFELTLAFWKLRNYFNNRLREGLKAELHCE